MKPWRNTREGNTGIATCGLVPAHGVGDVLGGGHLGDVEIGAGHHAIEELAGGH